MNTAKQIQKMTFFSFIMVFLWLMPSFIMAQAPLTGKEVVKKMLQSVDQLQTVQYSTKISERINGKLEVGDNFVKLQVKPFKAYVKVSNAELLYVTGQNNNKALVRSSSVPYMNLNLDPYGSNLRKGQHHTIFQLGFHYFSDIVSDAMKKSGDDFDQYFSLKGSIKWENHDCYVIVIDYPDFNYLPYIVKENEDLNKIARSLKVSEHMILEKNPGVKFYDDVKPGQKIIVPNAYAQKTLIYIDKKTLLPIFQAVSDEKGLFAIYEFKDVIVNPKFTEEEFTKTYKDYKFW
jgi:outer membrane lipoprotein-sorting protein